MSKTEVEETPGKVVKRRVGIRLERPNDVRRLLQRLINQTMAGETSTDVLRAVSYACQCILKTWELTTLEERMMRIEEALRGGK